MRVSRRVELLVIVLLACASHLSAQLAPAPVQPEETEGATSLLFRRVFVPREDLAALVKGYMPLRRDDVESMIQLINRAVEPNPAAASARIQSASYRARLRGSELVAGTARLAIRRVLADPDMEDDGLVPLSLSPLQLATGQAQWQLTGQEDRVPAVLGCDAAGKPVCLVPSDGELQFQWSRNGELNSLGEIRFQLDFPGAPTSELLLELPADVTPVCDVGYLQQVPPPEGAADGLAEGEANRILFWQVDLGGHNRLQLTIRPSSPFGQRRQLIFLRQQTDFSFRLGELELNAQFHLDVYNEPLRQLQLSLDGLKLLSARVGEDVVSWTVEGDGPGQVHNLAFPNGLLGQNHTLVVQAIGAVEMEVPQRLPTVQLKRVFWREGEIQLQIPADLSLQDLEVTGGNVTRAQPDEEGGETRIIQSHQPAPEVRVLLARRREQIELQTALQIDLDPPRATARWNGLLTSVYGNQFELSGSIMPGWLIDSLETVPAAAIDDYEIQELSQGRTAGRLRIKLKQAVTPARDVQLVIRAHRAMTPQGLEGHQLTPVRFENVKSQEGIVAIQIAPPFQLQLRQDHGITRLSADDVSGPLASVINAEGNSLIVSDSPAVRDLRLIARQARPRYDALIAVRAEVRGEVLTESYSVSCRPQSTALGRVLLHLDRESKELIQWRLAGVDSRELIARRLSREQQQQRGLGSGETWEVVLPEPLAEEFTLIGAMDSPLAKSHPLRLLALPEASNQLATLAVASTQDELLETQARGLKRIPPPVSPLDHFLPPIATYRYQPAMQNRVEIHREPASQESSAAWVWHARLRSRLTGDGQAHHHAHYSLENAGRSQVSFDVPTGVSQLEVYLDGQQLAASQVQHTGQRVVVDLPEKQRYVSIELQFQQPLEPLGMFTSVVNQIPQPDCPILDGESEVLLPTGYHVLDPANGLTGQRHPVSWGERMFGPLWASAAEENQVATIRPVAQIRNTQLKIKLNATLGRLDALIASSGAARPSSWGEMYEQLSSLLGSSDNVGQRQPAAPFRWWFDQLALQQAGVYADAALPPTASSFRDVLKALNLRLVVAHDWIMLTSSGAGVLQWLPIQWEDDGIGQLVQTHDDSHQATPGLPGVICQVHWLSVDRVAGTPWRQSGGVAREGLADRKWTLYRQPLGATSFMPITVYHELTLRSLGLALMLLLFVAFSWLLAKRPDWLPSLLLATAAIAMLAPAWCYPFSTLGWLALLAVVLLRLVYPHSPVTGSLESGTPSELGFQLQLAPRRLGMLVLFLALLGFARLSGQESEPGKSQVVDGNGTKRIVHRMLIPVDEEGEPTGQYNYVPEVFFDELHRRAGELDLQRQQWVIRSARYLSSWDWSEDQQELQDGPITATYQLHVAAAGQRVELPIRADQVQLGDVLLDGQPLQFEISPEDQTLAFVTGQPGIHELSLQLTPRRNIEDGTSQLEFDVPQSLDTQLRIQLPSDAPLPRIVNRHGSMSYDDVSGQLVAQLGAVENLAIQWRAGDVDPQPERLVVVQPNYWLRVQPHAVTLDARFQFQVLAGSVDTIQLETDPRLRLISVQGGQSIAGPPRVRSDETQTILFSLEDSQQEDFVLETSFYLNQTSGIGNLQLPRIHLLADRILDTRLAITVSDQIEWRLDVGEDIEESGIEEFAQQWGAADVPQRAQLLRGEDPEWNLATRYKLPQSDVSSKQDITIGAHETQLEYQADVVISGGGQLQLQLRLPVAMDLDILEVHNEDGPVPLQWEQADDGSLMVLLQRPLFGSCQLRLSGSIATITDVAAMPTIQFSEARVHQRDLRLFRRPTTSVVIDKVADDVRMVPGQESIVEGHEGRLVATFHRRDVPAGPMDSTAVLHVRTQQPESQATLVSWLSREENDWIARVDCDLQVTSGVLDQLRLEIPAAWAESTSVVPQMSIDVLQIPGQTRRQLILTPPQPFSELSTLSVTFRVPVATDVFRIPDVDLLDTKRDVRYLVLPDKIDDTLIQWATSGLRRVNSLPASLQYDVPEEASVFIGVAPHYEADIRGVEQVGGTRQSALADVRVVLQSTGKLVGVMECDLVPAGSDKIQVKMPAGYTLVHARVAGVAAIAQPLDDGSLEFNLHSSQLPQRIELLFQSDLASQIRQLGSLTLAAPELVGVEPDEILWSVVGSRTLGRPQATSPFESLDNAAATRMRIQQMLSMIELSSELATVSQVAAMEDWYLPWQRRFHQEYQLLLRQEVSDSQQIGQRLTDIAGRYEQLQLQLGLGPAGDELAEAYSLPSSAGELFSQLLTIESTSMRYRAAGGEAIIRVRFAGNSSGKMLARILYVVFSATLLLLGAVAYRKLRWRKSLERVPFAWGGVIGFAWWLLLTPAAIGLLLVLWSALAALRHAWGDWLAETPNRVSRTASTVTFMK